MRPGVSAHRNAELDRQEAYALGHKDGIEAAYAVLVELLGSTLPAEEWERVFVERLMQETEEPNGL